MILTAIISFFIGTLIGGFIGMALTCVVVAGKRSDV